MLFWHLLGREKAHIRQVCCGFSVCESLKIPLFIRFQGVEGVNYLSSVAAGVARLRATLPKIQAKA